MKKIPTLFERTFKGHKVIAVSDKPIPGMEWVLKGKGIATVKWDGSCCMIKDGKFYKRYDAKKGKNPPVGAIPCCETADPVTGHWPHWVLVDPYSPADQWFMAALQNTKTPLCAGTYEAIGPHFNGNPYSMDNDVLVLHGVDVVEVGRSFEEIRQYLGEHAFEGLVFWKDGEPQCKIKRRDFGFLWPLK